MEERKMPAHIVAAAGIVIGENGKLLLVKSNDNGWVFPGGQVEEGENVIEGVKREIREESGIEAQVGELFCVSSNTSKHPGYNGVKTVPTKVVLDFICKAVGGAIRTSDENSETGWFTKEEAAGLITSSAIAERFRAYLEYDGRPTYLSYKTKPEFSLDLKIKI